MTKSWPAFRIAAAFYLLCATFSSQPQARTADSAVDGQIFSIIDDIEQEIDQLERQAREIEIKARQRAPQELLEKLEAEWRENIKKESQPAQEPTPVLAVEEPPAEQKEQPSPPSPPPQEDTALQKKEAADEAPATQQAVSPPPPAQPPSGQSMPSRQPAIIGQNVVIQSGHVTLLLSLAGVCLFLLAVFVYVVARTTKHTRLALKLASGFLVSLVAVVTVIIAAVSLAQDIHLRQRAVTEVASFDEKMMQAQFSLVRIRDAYFNYLLTNGSLRKNLAAIEENIDAASGSIAAIVPVSENGALKDSQIPSEAPAGKTASAQRLQSAYQGFLKNIRELMRIHDEVLSYSIYVGDSAVDFENWILKTEVEHMQWVGQLAEAIASDGLFKGEFDPKACSFGTLFYSYAGEDDRLRQLLQAAEAPHQQFHLLGKKINDSSDRAERVDIYNKELRPVVGTVKDAFEEVRFYVSPLLQRKNLERQAALRVVNESFVTAQEELNEFEALLRQEHVPAFALSRQRLPMVKIIVIIVGLAAVIAGGAFSVRLSFLLVHLISERFARLTMNANQATAMAGLMAQTSQHFLQRTSEEALSLNKLSTSLDGIRSLNAQSSNQARAAQRLVQGTHNALFESNRSMQSMQAMISDIDQATEKITKMMKMVEDISFQTNLLALNAMVEALKAGEQGKGFAMVAENVCDLSRRVKDIVKDATSLMNDNINKVKNSSETAQRIAESFKQVMDSSQKLEHIVSDIDTLSRKQTESTGDIAGVVSDVSEASQKNTAIANESIFSSKELLSKVETLQGVLRELEQVAGRGISVFSHAKTTAQEPAQQEVITYHATSEDHEMPA